MNLIAISDLARRQLIEKSARQAADEGLGAQINPCDARLPDFEHWLNTYNAHKNAVFPITQPEEVA